MGSLAGACLLFLGMHWIVSGSPLRTPIANLLGERLFKALFAIIITLSLVWMAFAFMAAPYAETWGTAQALKPFSIGLMLLSFLLLISGVLDKNPTTLGLVPPDQVEARGMVRVTRHGGLLGLGLWGLAHFMVNGDWASHLLYGTIAIEGLIGPLNLDRKYRIKHGAAWDKFAAQTSYLPFSAILSGRNKLVLSEINGWMVLAAIGLFGLVMYYHQAWFGVALLP